MARLATIPFEAQAIAAEGDGLVSDAGSAGAYVTSPVHGGSACWKINNAQQRLSVPFTGVASRAYYARTYFNTDNVAPSIECDLLSFRVAGPSFGLTIRLNTNGTIQLSRTNDTVTLGSASAAISTATWYCLEMKLIVPAAGAATYELRVNQEVISSGTDTNIGNNLPIALLIGSSSGGTQGNQRFDDVALNDDQGTNQNSYPGAALDVLLKPTSDGTVSANWTGGAGGTTNRWDAVNNAPPVGVVLASATNTSQIKNIASNATDTANFNLGAYTTAVASGGGGLATNDQVVLVQGVFRGGNSTTTSRTLAGSMVSNPAITEVTQASGTTAAGTDPTGWTTFKTAVSYLPAVTLATQPVIQIRKGTASTDAAMHDLVGLLVEYVPGIGASLIQRMSPAQRPVAPTGGTF